MASKGKKAAAASSSSASKRPRLTHFNPRRFLTLEAQEWHDFTLEERNIIEEKAIVVSELPPNSPIRAVIERRNWHTFVTFPCSSPSTILKEFFANVDFDTVRDTRQSWVRGKIVPFTVEAISHLLDLPNIDNCQYCNYYNAMSPGEDGLYHANVFPTAAYVRHFLTHPHSKWIPRTADRNYPDKLQRKDLNAEANFWHSFNNATVFPSSNISDVNVERASFLTALLGPEPTSAAIALSDSLLHMVCNRRDSARLGHSSLIMKLCAQAEVQFDLGDHCDVDVDSPLTQANYIKYCREYARRVPAAEVERQTNNPDDYLLPMNVYIPPEQEQAEPEYEPQAPPPQQVWMDPRRRRRDHERMMRRSRHIIDQNAAQIQLLTMMANQMSLNTSAIHFPPPYESPPSDDEE